MALTILCVSFTLLCCWACRWPSIGLSPLATILYEGLPLAVVFQQMISGDEPVLVPGDPVLHLRGREMLYGGIADRIVASPRPGGPRARGLGMGQRARLHPVRRRVGLAGGRRLGDGRGDDPDDEARATAPTTRST